MVIEIIVWNLFVIFICVEFNDVFLSVEIGYFISFMEIFYCD